MSIPIKAVRENGRAGIFGLTDDQLHTLDRALGGISPRDEQEREARTEFRALIRYALNDVSVREMLESL
jgi:hypothetical protein